jgi:DNA repair exonuclease SbcCD nuclease subunit
MIYVVGDLHFGARKNNHLFHETLKSELKSLLAKVEKEDTVIFLGDVFESRSSIEFCILNDAWDFFIELSHRVKEVFILIGNHDFYYRTNESESVNCRFLRFENTEIDICPVHIIDKIAVQTIEGHKCLFIPWVDTVEMKDRTLDYLVDSYDFIFGHFDIIGLYGEEVTETSFSPSDFSKKSKVLSGHFHRRTDFNHIKYVGSLISTTFNDVENPKGIHTIDTKGKIEFIEGNSPIFYSIEIENSQAYLDMIQNISEEQRTKLTKRIRNNIIRLKLNEYSSQNNDICKFFKSLSPLEVHIEYLRSKFDEDENQEYFEGFDKSTNIASILHQYIDNIKEELPPEIDIGGLKKLIEEEYNAYQLMVEST